MKIKPLDDNILIRREKPQEKTHSGIILMTNREEKMEKGQVLLTGKDVKDIKKGDNILFKNYSLDIIELDGEEQAFIKRENVLAVIQ